MEQFDNSFYNINDLIECVKRGCEVEFLYKEKKYGITHIAEGIVIYEFNDIENEKIYSQAEEISQHTIAGERLSDIAADIKIIFRSL